MALPPSGVATAAIATELEPSGAGRVDPRPRTWYDARKTRHTDGYTRRAQRLTQR